MVAQGVAGGLRKVATLPEGRSEPGQGGGAGLASRRPSQTGHLDGRQHGPEDRGPGSMTGVDGLEDAQ